MFELLLNISQKNKEQVYLLLRHYLALERRFLLRSDLWDEFALFFKNDPEVLESFLACLIVYSQEVALEAPWVYVAVRERVGKWVYIQFHLDTVEFQQVDVSQFLFFKERLVLGKDQARELTLELDLGPFNRDFPKLKESRSIGRGVEFLNRHLSSRLFASIDKGDKRLLDFLRVHQFKGQQLMLNDRLADVSALSSALRRAEDYLSGQPQDAGWVDVAHVLQSLGFEIGWGNIV